jgi:hypothetical protein
MLQNDEQERQGLVGFLIPAFHVCATDHLLWPKAWVLQILVQEFGILFIY